MQEYFKLLSLEKCALSYYRAFKFTFVVSIYANLLEKEKSFT